MSYAEFLKRKSLGFQGVGIPCEPDFRVAARNLAAAERGNDQLDLFAALEAESA